jgi:glycosyltransferase involved in cell wall biosynthesis
MGPWIVLLAVSAAVVLYAYAAYPLLLLAARAVRRAPAVSRSPPAIWPRISITLAAFNAESTLRPVLEALVRTQYPADRRQILVVSDGSTDGTDAIVRAFAPQGVELLRIDGRLGKTEVENRAASALTGEIVINTDASVTIHPDAVWRLVAALADPGVGVASGRDVSVASVGAVGEASEAAYVGYEMRIRDLETAVSGIVGASGCLYAIRAPLHRRQLPGHLSRDFSSALWARAQGARAVSVRDAICYVPRAAGMQTEYRRKIRTMSRGIQTLFHHSRLLDPVRYGWFAWMLWSHKLIRWLVPWALAVGAVALAALMITSRTAAPTLSLWAGGALGVAVVALLLAAAGWWWPTDRPAPRLTAIAGYIVSGTVAGVIAWKRALMREGAAVWEPTPRAVGNSANN